MFCSLTQSRTSSPPKKAVAIAREIRELVIQEKTRYVSFNDSAISVQRFRELCSAIKKSDIRYYWSCLLRFEGGFEYEDFKNAYESGCRLIQFGLESGSQRLLNQLRKGVSLKNIETILEWCNLSGIFVNCFIFYRFPTETEMDCDQTLAFLQKNMRVINNLAYGPFRLERLSRVYRSPADFNIASIDTNKLELVPFAQYRVKDSTKENDDYFIVNFNHKFSFAPFLGQYLDNADEFPAFFELLCRNVHDVKKKSRERARSTKNCKDILFNCSDFKFSLAASEIEIHPIPCDENIRNAWMLRKSGFPMLRRINSTYATTLKLLSQSPFGGRFSRVLSMYTGRFHIPDTLAQRDLRMMFLDLYDQGVLWNIESVKSKAHIT